ncbi:PAS modulated sigma54 specific transcriptional regulator, Fis family [Desulfosarcina cetonica]|uniref:sigma-54 interaction domain-containing protein n=1 Tax=Desulfosarcina cetonica TaxID=90730 RepID=UPI0006D09B6E|nr:sigma 54-interacting transcriptional regulator [Desulfosarcina cetonica]VTR67943.1 PAS modulated sigma54 specific transcriptional regulator, Fis family [Desulfosarcina cetonica]
MDIAKYWKTIVDTLQDGLLVVDPRGRIVAANPSAERITGYTAEELIGKSCRILNCSGCKIIGKGAGTDWCGLFSRGSMKEKKCLITNKDQHSIHIVKSASVLKDKDGQIIGAVETLTDITEKIRQQQEISSLRKTFHLDEGYHGILGKSQMMLNLFEMIENVAQSDTPVMIQGESGSGKELVARAIHRASNRSEKPYIKVNCAALNENLLESELFGHVKGAYTGADRTRAGRFEAAHEGTIFLDEIGDIPPAIQVKLLRVLEERRIERVGDNRSIPVDVRVITATHKNLESLIERGLFRQDLYFRINVFPLHCPSLAQRREDIPLIAQSFIRRNAISSGKKILGLTPEALEALTGYAWPGNVRELRNAIEYAFVLCQSGGIGLHHLPHKIMHASGEPESTCHDDPECAQTEREALIGVLRQAGGIQSKAAEILGVSRVTVWKRMKKYGIDIRRDVN